MYSDFTMDLPQLLLLTAIFILSVILTVIGIQIIFLLRDARETLRKADQVVANLDFLTTSLTRTSSSFSHLSASLQSGLQLAGLVTKVLANKKK